MENRSAPDFPSTRTSAEQNERIASAKASLKERLGELGRRAKRIELREKIVAHPLPAVGIAMAAGALLGLVRKKPERGRVSAALIAAFGAIAVRVVREAALHQVGELARQWLERYQEEQAEEEELARPMPPVYGEP